MPVPHSYFPCSDVQGKSLSYCHAAACIKACLHSHWKDVPCLQGFSVSDNRDIFQPAAYVEGFLAEPWKFDTNETVGEELAHQIATIGENMNIRRFQQVKEENGFVASYTHMGGKIGVLVDVETDVVNDDLKEMAKNVAMQVAAISPKYTSRDEVSKDYIEHETEILKVQAMNENPDKPENIIEKMIVGRLNKELKEVCLLDQAYVKAEDGKQAVGKYVEQVAKANGANVTIKGFVRFETGEGIEKKEEDFAAEVAAQMNA